MSLCALHVGAGEFCSGCVGLCNPDKASGQKKCHPGERILNCAECIEFFCICHKYSAVNSNGYKTNVYDFVISKTLVLSFEFSSIRNFASAAVFLFFFFIVATDKVSWKQNHTSELINADLKVPVQGDDLLGRNSNVLVLLQQLVLFWSTKRIPCATEQELPPWRGEKCPSQSCLCCLGAGGHQGNGPELKAEIAVFCLNVELVLKAVCHGWGMRLMGMVGEADSWTGWAQWSFPVLMILWQKAVSPPFCSAEKPPRVTCALESFQWLEIEQEYSKAVILKEESSGVGFFLRSLVFLC